MTARLVREEQLTGTAGGVKHLAGVVERTRAASNEPFVVVSGDALTDVDIRTSSPSTKRRVP
jgi:NDP-sugar pyrophosphorylase family protein